MSEIALRQESVPATALPAGEDRVQWLLTSVLRNRFLPQPAPDSVFVGDGDFKAVGAEFLGHFIRMGGLQPESRVLDIGCGIGRMAVPLTQYLDFEKGRYSGIDPVEGGIAWCRRFIAPAYPNFAFQRVDIAHDLYNPQGKISGKALKLPYADRHFDFVIMTSIVTHLPPDEVLVYLSEIGRLLRPGGRLFMTAFVVDSVAAANETGRRDPRLSFQRDGDGPCWFVPDLPRLAAVGFDDGFLDGALGRAGLAAVTKSLGSWRGQAADHYQDVFVAEQRGSNA
ncbi:methyltransferase domain-containing protein [Ensifer sp. IC3342]|nr:methyltransferase domain-containing protein [Ensifer sp. IC3342]